MSIIVKDNQREYSPAPEGLHLATCIDAIDRGVQPSQYGDRHVVELRWILEAVDPQTSMPYMVVARYTSSLGSKSRLRAMLESWRTKKFSPAELQGFDLEKLVGCACQVQIVHNISSDGTTWANVQAIVAPPKNTVKPAIPPNYIRMKDRDKPAEINAHGVDVSDAIPF